MTKDVLVSLRGLQFEAEEENEEIETIVPASYFYKEERQMHYLLYDEVVEGFEEHTRTKLKFCPAYLDLTRTGLINVHMLFEENKKNLTSYQTPFGGVLVGIDTKKIHIEQEKNRICCDVDYALDINYEYLTDCHIRIDVRPRSDAGDLVSP